jgi:hypothetical protein
MKRVFACRVAVARHLSSLSCLLVLCSVTANAQEHCGYPLAILKSGFENGEQPPSVILPAENTPLVLTVDYPTDNLTVGSDTIQIYGSYTGPSNTGIVANNAPLPTNASNFASYPLTLTPGTNMISVVGTTLDGSPQTITRTVIFDANQRPDVEFQSAAFAGYAPARVAFSLNYRIPAGQTVLSRVEIDYDGDGNFDVDAAAPPSRLEYAFGSGGFYTATARLSFDDGSAGTPLIIRTGSAKVLMQTMAFTRQTLCGVYYGMKHRLQPGQSGIASALNTLEPDLRPEFQTLWNDLGAGLTSTANQLGDIVDGQISDVTAEMLVAVPDPAVVGEFFGFPVVLRRGTDGVWRISEM